MGLTTYGGSVNTLTGTNVYLPSGPSWTMTGFTYANPLVTVTTSTNHSIQVGNRVTLQGLVQAGTTGVLTSSSYNVTAVTSNTFTFSFGATTPSNYTSGGLVKLTNIGNPGVAAYLNGRYIFAMGPCYVYSTDGLNWDMAQLPSAGSAITSMAFDGTTYIFAAGTSGLWSSTTLAQGSWTNRSTFGTNFFCHDVKWYGGSVNRFVAVGSSDSSPNGVGGRIEVATSGGATWTNQTIGGTSVGAPFRQSAWDNSTTIVAVSESGLAISTNSTSTWTGYSSNATYAPSPSGVSGAPNMGFNGADTILWNPVASKWMTFYYTNGSYYGNASTTTPATYWTRGIPQEFATGKTYTSSATNGAGNSSGMNVFNYIDNLIQTFRFDGGEFQVIRYSPNPITLDTHTEVYPFVSLSTGRNMPGVTQQDGTSGQIKQSFYAAVYGANKWVTIQSVNPSRYATGFNITVFQ